MNDTELQKIDDFMTDVQSVNPEFAKIIKQISDIFTGECEELLLGIKYGGLVFFYRGELIGGIFPYKKHLSIEFSNGATFADPSSLLEGKGKQRRHLKIFTKDDIDSKNAWFFIKQAVGRCLPFS